MGVREPPPPSGEPPPLRPRRRAKGLHSGQIAPEVGASEPQTPAAPEPPPPPPPPPSEAADVAVMRPKRRKHAQQAAAAAAATAAGAFKQQLPPTSETATELPTDVPSSRPRRSRGAAIVVTEPGAAASAASRPGSAADSALALVTTATVRARTPANELVSSEATALTREQRMQRIRSVVAATQTKVKSGSF